MNQQCATGAARQLLDRASVLLLDFDGPVCSVFDGIPAQVIADQLRAVLADAGYSNLPGSVAQSADPFEVFHFTSTLGESEARYVETAFTAHEVEAIRTARPTPGSFELIRGWNKSGRRIAIVSNNSQASIEAYLHLYGIKQQVAYISARTFHDPRLLKPNPKLVTQAVEALSSRPIDCLLVGDSINDVEAARSAGVPVLGFANKTGKQDQLLKAGANATSRSLRFEEPGP